MLKILTFVCAAALLVSATASNSVAQGTGGHVVRLVVPLPPGGGDFLARTVASPLEKLIGKTIIIENKPGADGEIAARYVKQSKADGSVIFFATNSPLCAVPALRKAPPYDPEKDFTPISLGGVAGFFLFANPNLPAKTVGELIEYARANPGKINAGVSNSTSLIAIAQLMSSAKIDVVKVPYAGDGKAIPALLRGEIDILFATITSARGFLESGELRLLATTLPERSKMYPDAPTLRESGLPGTNVSAWFAIFGPPGMPRAVVDEYAAAVDKVMKIPSVRERLESFAIKVQTSTPEEMAEILKENLEITKRTVEEGNLPKS